jgi:hypothetical protein
MKVITLKIKPSRKETQEERKERVRNDTNRANVYANRKAYKRHQKHKGGNDYES